MISLSTTPRLTARRQGDLRTLCFSFQIRSVPIKHVEAIDSVLMAALKSDKKKKGGGPAELKTDRN